MHGFPPMLIQVGENEILYDDAIRIRDAATTAGVIRSIRTGSCP
jgi:acetyl esterase/lipase